MKQDHEEFQGHLDHKVQVVVREFQERLENQDKWVSQVLEDQMGHKENQELMEKLDLQVLQVNKDSQDLRVQEDSQDFQVVQD